MTQTLAFPTPIPFIDHLGMTLTRMQDGWCEMAYQERSDHLNTFAVVHGGVAMTLLDVCMAHAGRSLELAMGIVTVEMKTSFVQPATGDLVCQAKVLHRTRTMAFTEGSVRNAQGQLCSHATGTFRYVSRLAVGKAVANLNPGDGA
ncbi:MAG: PaaI family thioesterase [Proteobacteria bacterium]|nr:PaaI family thioesterase [Pseudomonadota bacterium]